MIRRLLVGVAGFSFLVCFAIPASADLLTVKPSGGTTTTFAAGSTCSGFASSGTDAGFAISTNGPSCFPYNANFGFSSNGSWSGFGLIGDNSGTTSLTINLGGTYSSVGGFMDYAVTSSGPFGNHPTISALASDGTTVLESYDLFISAPINTPGQTNAGAFRGISRNTADIAYFRIGGSYIAEHDITLSAVPEPTGIVLLATILAAVGWKLRKNRETAEN